MLNFCSCAKLEPQSMPLTSNKPSWIKNSNRDGYICSIGYANISQDILMAKKIAIVRAKANMSENIMSHIETQDTLKVECKNNNCEKDFDSKTSITSAQMIRDTQTENEYINEKENLYYIRLCSKL